VCCPFLRGLSHVVGVTREVDSIASASHCMRMPSGRRSLTSVECGFCSRDNVLGGRTSQGGTESSTILCTPASARSSVPNDTTTHTYLTDQSSTSNVVYASIARYNRLLGPITSQYAQQPLSIECIKPTIHQCPAIEVHHFELSPTGSNGNGCTD